MIPSIDGTPLIIIITMMVAAVAFALKSIYDRKLAMASFAGSISFVFVYLSLSMLAWRDLANSTRGSSWATLPDVAYTLPLTLALVLAATALYLQISANLARRRRVRRRSAPKAEASAS